MVLPTCGKIRFSFYKNTDDTVQIGNTDRNTRIGRLVEKDI